MKKMIIMAAVAMMAALNVQAQKIQVVDADGYGIPLVSVLSESGVLIGTTNLDGVLADVKGASKVALTHVAYKPQQVTVASMQDGRITMESVDYGLEEVDVKPKPYLYVEYYYRAFSYIGDSLRVYSAGIIPVAHEISKKYEGITRGVWAFGGAANKALAWNTMDMEDMAEKCAKTGVLPIEKSLKESKKFQEHYKTSLVPDGENRWLIRNPEEVVGNIVYDDGLSIVTLDAGRSQIYANKENGKEKRAKRQEEANYNYQYTEVFKLDEEGKVQPEGFVMEQNHWELDTKKGRRITIVYLYATEKAYMDKDEFKTRRKALSKGRAGDMTLNELAEYERTHNIPALAPEQQGAIQKLKKKTGE